MHGECHDPRPAEILRGAQAVIHGVDLEVADGEFAVLAGPSGCGKSASLRMIAPFREHHDRAPGQAVHLRPRADKAHLFDPETGARIGP